MRCDTHICVVIHIQDKHDDKPAEVTFKVLTYKIRHVWTLCMHKNRRVQGELPCSNYLYIDPDTSLVETF